MRPAPDEIRRQANFDGTHICPVGVHVRPVCSEAVVVALAVAKPPRISSQPGNQCNSKRGDDVDIDFGSRIDPACPYSRPHRRPHRPPAADQRPMAAGDPGGDPVGRDLHLAVRLCHEFLGNGVFVGAEHLGRRWHHHDAGGVPIRDNIVGDPQQGTASIAGRHGTGRGICQLAGLLADPGPLAGLPVGGRGVLDRCSVAAAELAAAGVAAMARNTWASRGSRASRRPVRRALPPRQRPAAARAGSGHASGRRRQKGGLARDIPRPAISRPHDRGADLLAPRLRRNDLRIGRVCRGLLVDHGATAIFVFLTFVVGSLVVFFAFQVNVRISEGIERRDVMCAMACLFAATFVVVYLAPNLWIIASFFVLSRIAVSLWLFNLYNYTAVAYPTRIRATAFAWTDGLGHLGAWGEVTLLGPLYAWGPNHLGWFLWLLIPGSLIPAIVIRTFGVKQSRVVLEQVST